MTRSTLGLLIVVALGGVACGGSARSEASKSSVVTQAAAEAVLETVTASADNPSDCPLITTTQMEAIDPAFWSDRGYSSAPPLVEVSPGTEGRTLYCAWGPKDGDRIFVGLGVGDWLIDNYDDQIDAAVAAGDQRDGSGAWGIGGFLSHESPSTSINLWFDNNDFVTEARAREFRAAVLDSVRTNVAAVDEQGA